MPERTRIKIAELEKRLGRSRQTIWRSYSVDDFPKPHYLGRDRVWFEDEIEVWEQKKMAEMAAQKAGAA